MSATNRGDARQADDFYSTPTWATAAIVPHLTYAGGAVLDPCAGRGAVLDALCTFDKFASPATTFDTIEIDSDRAHDCALAGFPGICGNALEASTWGRFDAGGNLVRPSLIITNPPYSLAMDFLIRALMEVADGGEVAMLLRVGFLGSAERAAFHRANPSDLNVLPRRPEFVMSIRCAPSAAQKLAGAKACGYAETRLLDAERPKACPTCGGRVQISTSDASEYAWFCWRRGMKNGIVRVLEVG